MKEISVKIHRYNQKQGSYIQNYHLNIDEQEICSIMNLLELIYKEQDSTLAFFSHAACKQAACGKCLVKVNGKIKLACKEKAEGTDIEIEPHSQMVIKDLICQ